MPYLNCGCWTGPYHSVMPPPRCAQHSGGTWTQTWTEPSLPEDWVDILRGAAPGTSAGKLTIAEPPSIETRLAEVADRIKQLVSVERDDNPAVADAWQLALDQLRQLQTAVVRARTVEDAK
jgi:hypothetical protein